MATNMRYGRETLGDFAATLVAPVEIARPAPPSAGGWRTALPVLTGDGVMLRELIKDDAPSLFSMLSSQEVTRFISSPPSSLDGVERFIDWTHREREAGVHLCFGIVPAGMSVAVGMIQVRQTEPGFATAEWGFALGSPYWGTGLFVAGARAVLDFLFQVVGVRRLEARAAIRNGRGNAALRKIGAVQEGRLRRSFVRDGEYSDQVLWAILDCDREPDAGAGWQRVH